MSSYFTIRWIDDSVRMLDQRLLPQEVVYRTYTEVQEVAQAIKDMVIRGAPAIGAAAGYGMALAAMASRATSAEQIIEDLTSAAKLLKAARPTAVNLNWALERVMSKVKLNSNLNVQDLRQLVLVEAEVIAEEDVETNRKMSMNGLAVVPDNAKIIHHCNTGALATVDYGTALGVIRAAHEHGKRIHVYVDETRPRLQGAKLTSWELKELGVPHTVMADSASGHIMRTIGIDLCLVGCDRIAANGDVANKIGTYNLALVASAHGVPFYSVGPTTTIDITTPSGDQIPIEERPAQEVTHVGDYQITPDGVNIANPAFDVTPARYINGIITERGIIRPPYVQNIAEVMNR
jgi:methylthioribose-1-phosphate isomerase